MQVKLFIRLLTAVCLAGTITSAIADEASKLKGLEIATERKSRDIGWGDSTGDVTMVLRNASGQEAERAMRMKSFEMKDDGDKALTVFDSPRDVSGHRIFKFLSREGT